VFYLSLTYTEWSGASGVAYTVQRSDDLANWMTGPGFVLEVGAPIDNGDGTRTRTFRSTTPLDNQSRQFMRLQVAN